MQRRKQNSKCSEFERLLFFFSPTEKRLFARQKSQSGNELQNRRLSARGKVIKHGGCRSYIHVLICLQALCPLEVRRNCNNIISTLIIMAVNAVANHVLLNVRNHIENSLLSILRQLENVDMDPNVYDSCYFRLDCVYHAVARYHDVIDEGNTLLNILTEARQIMSRKSENPAVCYIAGQVFTGERGRPKYNVPQDQLEYFLQKRFSVKEIAEMLGVSKRTVERRVNGFGLSVSRCTSKPG